MAPGVVDLLGVGLERCCDVRGPVSLRKEKRS